MSSERSQPTCEQSTVKMFSPCDCATALMNFDTTNDVNGVTYERADTLGSGGIPVKVVPLNGGYVLVQGQETGENVVKVNVQTGFKTYWHEVFQ